MWLDEDRRLGEALIERAVNGVEAAVREWEQEMIRADEAVAR
jgi:hypothetical protein